MEFSTKLSLGSQVNPDNTTKVSYWFGTRETTKLTENSIPENQYFLKGLIELNKREYQECVQATNNLNTLWLDSKVFLIAVWNFLDLEQEFEKCSKAFTVKDKNYFRRDPYLNLNRYILNLLAAVRTYLDHTETSLNRKYGKGSDIFRKFEELTSQVYDNNFSYRFLYKLRDYAQHCGMPIGSFQRGVHESKQRPGEPEYYLDIYFKRDSLLQGFNWKKLRTEIEQLPQEIPIFDHIISMMNSLLEINEEIIKTKASFFQPSALYLKQYLEKLSGYDGEPFIFAFTEELDDSGKIVQLLASDVTEVPVKLIDAILMQDIAEFTGVQIKSKP